MNLNENIRRYRKNAGITQKQLASTIGRKSGIISNWETGANSPYADDIVRLCNALEVDPNSLFGWDERGLQENEVLLLEFYRRLNTEGQGNLSRTAEGLTAVAEYKKGYKSIAMASNA